MDSIDKEISKNALEDFGWNLDEFNSGTPASSHFVYFRDWREDRTWLVCLPQLDFDKTNVSTELDFEDVVSGVATIINKTYLKSTLSNEDNELYAPLLINYIKQTKNFDAWYRQAEVDQKLHFVINIYADSKLNNDAITLRPFIINTDGLMLSTGEIGCYTEHVMNNDKQNHPEWFC